MVNYYLDNLKIIPVLYYKRPLGEMSDCKNWKGSVCSESYWVLRVILCKHQSGSHIKARNGTSQILMKLVNMMGLLQELHFRQIFLKSQSRYHGNRDHAKMAKSGQISICKPLNLGNV